jgi:hypothetical protein
MQTTRRLSFFTMVLVLMWTASTSLVQAQKDSSLAGKWDVIVKGTPHGDMTATMVLQQDGEKMTGSFSAHGNDHALEGTMKNGALELAATDMPADTRLTLSGKLQKDGTLAGYLSGPVADAKWTASRAKDSK